MIGHNLSAMIADADQLQQVLKGHLQPGDYLVAKTRNSIYTMQVDGDGWFYISGGWFDRKGASPARLRINGCTWGGSVIKANVVAACGLCLEFSNRVTTSPIEKIVLLRNGIQN